MRVTRAEPRKHGFGLGAAMRALDEAAADRFTFIPILHPAPFEAAQIMAIQARREGLDFDADAAALALSSSPRAFSPRRRESAGQGSW